MAIIDRHTHEAVDQLFSRIAFALYKNDAPTLSAFTYHLENSFTPKPNVEELVFTLDFRSWLEPYLCQHIANISGPHRFFFVPENGNPLGHVWTREWSDTHDFDTGSFLSSLPSGTPSVVPLRPLFTRATSDAGVKQERDDFEKFMAQMNKYLYASGLVKPYEQEEWESFLEELKDTEQRAQDPAYEEPKPFEGWFPHTPSEVSTTFFGHAATDASALARDMAPEHTLSGVVARLERAEAAGRALWQGTITGEVPSDVRFHVEPQDAWKETKIGNIAVFSNKRTAGVTNETVLGEWERDFVVGAVTKHHDRDRGKERHNVSIRMFEPVIVLPGNDNGTVPLWAYNKVAAAREGGQPLSTAWKDVVGLRWEPVKILPTSILLALDPSWLPAPRSVVGNCFGSGVPGAKLKDGKYTLRHPVTNSRYVMKVGQQERDKGFHLSVRDVSRWKLLPDM